MGSTDGQAQVVGAVHADVAQQRGDRFAQLRVRVGPVAAAMARHSRSQLAVKGVGDGVDLQVRGQSRHLVVMSAGGVDQFGERSFARGIDEQSTDLAQRVVAGGARDGQARVERLVDGEDLLDDDPGLRPGDLAQPGQIAGRIGKAVRVVDADPVDQSFVEPPLHLDVAWRRRPRGPPGAARPAR